MLEDDFTYVLRKALLGHSLTPAAAAARAGVEAAEVQGFLDGGFSRLVALKLAEVLGLNPDAFGNHPLYHPAETVHAGIHHLRLPFNGDHVNAWLLESDGCQVLFDAGQEADDLVRALLGRCGRFPDVAFITHGHHDHVGGVRDLTAAGVPLHGPEGCGVSHVVRAGESFRCGGLTVRACDLSGHAVPALGYHVDGLDVPVLVTGDALFAGSIGGCPTSGRYQLALESLRRVLGPLPDETVLLPGHGPLSTLGEERSGNPFL